MTDLAVEFSGAVFDALEVGLIGLDTDGRVVAWNAWLSTASGIASQRAIGTRLYDLFPDLAKSRLAAAISDALEAGVSSLLTHSLNPRLFPLKTRAGRALAHNVAVRPLGGKPFSGCLVQINDVTLAAHRESLLRERQNARYHAVVDNAYDPIVTIDAEGLMQLANPAASRGFGYTREELLGKPIEMLIEEQEAWDEVWDAVLQGEVLHRPVQLVGRRKDGSHTYLEVSASQWSSYSRLFVTAIFRDINERHAAEEALRSLNQTLEQRVSDRTAKLMEAEERLRQSQKMEAVGQLTGGIAHDFNNLLQVIIGNVDVLVRNLPDDAGRLRRSAENAMTGANRAAVLTQRLLAFGRRQPLAPSPLDPNALIREMTELLHRSLGEHIQIETALATDLWWVDADPNQLENAILNLAVNARDAMPGGGILTISTSNTSISGADVDDRPLDLSAGQYATICITDTGSGMSPDVIERVFEPFFTTKEVGRGTGLGLSQVYGFAKQSGGHVEINSEPGQGTTVKIHLPRLHSHVPPHEAASSEQALMGARGETVLVVEDDDDVRAYSVEILRELRYNVLEACDGPSALRILEGDAQIDVLFTDLVLPQGMNGTQLASEAQRLRPDLKVIFTTGYASESALEHGSRGADIHLMRKPFTSVELSAKMREIMDV